MSSRASSLFRKGNHIEVDWARIFLNRALYDFSCILLAQKKKENKFIIIFMVTDMLNTM